MKRKTTINKTTPTSSMWVTVCSFNDLATNAIFAVCNLSVSFLRSNANWLMMKAYRDFNIVIYKWLRFFGLAQGHDILHAEWNEWTFYTIFALTTAISIPFMYMWTMYHYSGDLAMKAFGYLGIGYQVCMLLNDQFTAKARCFCDFECWKRGKQKPQRIDWFIPNTDCI